MEPEEQHAGVDKKIDAIAPAPEGKPRGDLTRRVQFAQICTPFIQLLALAVAYLVYCTTVKPAFDAHEAEERIERLNRKAEVLKQANQLDEEELAQRQVQLDAKEAQLVKKQAEVDEKQAQLDAKQVQYDRMAVQLDVVSRSRDFLAAQVKKSQSRLGDQPQLFAERKNHPSQGSDVNALKGQLYGRFENLVVAEALAIPVYVPGDDFDKFVGKATQNWPDPQKQLTRVLDQLAREFPDDYVSPLRTILNARTADLHCDTSELNTRFVKYDEALRDDERYAWQKAAIEFDRRTEAAKARNLPLPSAEERDNLARSYRDAMIQELQRGTADLYIKMIKDCESQADSVIGLMEKQIARGNVSPQ